MNSVMKTDSQGSSVRRIERIWRGFWQLSDPKIWVASLVPFVLGNCIAIARRFEIQWQLLFTCLVILILVEIGKNGLNEYVDYKSGADLYVQPKDRTPYSGGKKVIVQHVLSLSEVGWISTVCFAATLLLALPILIMRPDLLPWGAAGIFFAIAYSVPPVKLSYRGLGELAVGFTFGPLIMNGAYYMQTRAIHLEPLLLSIPLGFLIANVLWINEVPDVEADQRAQKWNLVARAGRKRALVGYITLFVLALCSIVLAAIWLQHFWYLLALLAFVKVPTAIRVARDYRFNSQKLQHSNALTIQTYLLTGALLSVAAFF